MTVELENQPENHGKGDFVQDAFYMRKAIELAKKGIGFVNPNPLVGAVIVKDGVVIGEGYHAQYGGLHGERNALNDCKTSPEGATLYVTLEPCSHYGKTPPCTDAIIGHKISRVVVGSIDPNPLVAGTGIQVLKKEGIIVDAGVLEKECHDLNEIFFHYITTGKPYVVMKYAMTADGKIATAKGFSKWITGEEARRHVHETRKHLAAIMVGIETVLKDDPMLNCRLPQPSHPIRIVCDSHLRIPLDSTLVKTAKQIPTYIAAVSFDEEKENALREMGVRLIRTGQDNGHVNLKQLMEILGKMKIDSILLEGGGGLNFSALQEGIVSKVQAYIAPKIFGGANAKTPVGGEGISDPRDCYQLVRTEVIPMGQDLLVEYRMNCESWKGGDTCLQE